MISKIIRIGITAVLFFLSIYMFFQGKIGNGIMFLLLAGLVLLTYFRNERILLAFWYLRKQDFPKAEKALKSIKDPEGSLIKGQAAYYYFLLGLIESQRGIGKAETLLKKALNIGLKQDHDKAMAKMSLAGFAVAKRRKKEAMVLLQEVKKLDPKGLLNDQVKMIKENMKRI
jgi:Tfp pilus assembly protein PilF